jgi:hypothetical protein
MVTGAAVLDGAGCCAWAVVNTQIRILKIANAVSTGNFVKADRWLRFIDSQPFLEMWDFIVAQLIPGRGGLIV